MNTNGKGDKPRNNSSKEFWLNYDQINWSSKRKKHNGQQDSNTADGESTGRAKPGTVNEVERVE